MKSEWKVTKNPVMEPTPYAVYRIKNIDKIDHSGNREYGGGYFKEKSAAQIFADYLNNKETGGKDEID